MFDQTASDDENPERYDGALKRAWALEAHRDAEEYQTERSHREGAKSAKATGVPRGDGHPARRQFLRSKGTDIPTLRDVMEAPNAIACPSYLVTLEGTKVQIREVPQQSGGIRYAVDQLINPDSITFSHGGFFSPEILLYGRVATVSDSAVAKKLFRAFSSAIAKEFIRIKGYWVGPQANGLLRKGCRLTMGAHSPKEYDLAV